MQTIVTYPMGTRSDGDRLRVGSIRTLEQTPTFRDAGWSAAPPPPGGTPPDSDRRRPGGDGDRPSKLEAIAMRLMRASNYLLLAAVVFLLIDARRQAAGR